MKMLNLFDKYITPTACLISFAAGLYISYGYNEIKHSKQLLDIQEQIVKQDTYNRKVIIDLQVTKAISDAKYITLKEKLDALPTVTNVPCKLTSNAVRVWNQSKGTEAVLPKDSTGTTDSTPTSNPIEGVDIKLVLEKDIENDRICNGLRSQINSIIKWDRETYGE